MVQDSLVHHMLPGCAESPFDFDDVNEGLASMIQYLFQVVEVVVVVVYLNNPLTPHKLLQMISQET